MQETVDEGPLASVSKTIEMLNPGWGTKKSQVPPVNLVQTED